jgi:HK97 family phage portal protein
MSLKSWIRENILEKLNPLQPIIQMEEGSQIPTNVTTNNYINAYRDIDIVRRGVDMIVNAAASFNITVTEQLKNVTPIISGTRLKTLDTILNYAPNPFQDINSFRRLIYMDLVLEGNAFIYCDSNEQYHLPAINVEVIPDKNRYVSGYIYSGVSEELTPSKVVHIKDNSSTTIYRGTTRLQAAEDSITTLKRMLNFQQNFFENGAVPGLILSCENVLSPNIKQRMLETWQARYNPKSGGRRPIILDGGLKIDSLFDADFTKLDFEDSIANKEKSILKTLGIPPILLDGGNNANIAPNLRLFYLETVVPLVRAFTSAMERYYGYDLEEEATKVSSLQPELAEVANYCVSLVNGGLITPNEARSELRWDKFTGDSSMDEIRIPQNIAGSAVNPTQGGRPRE